VLATVRTRDGGTTGTVARRTQHAAHLGGAGLRHAFGVQAQAEYRRQNGGLAGVAAGKLLTRKRLFLIPVHDDAVRYASDRPKEIWTALRDALRQGDGSFTAGLEELIKRAGMPA